MYQLLLTTCSKYDQIINGICVINTPLPLIIIPRFLFIIVITVIVITFCKTVEGMPFYYLHLMHKVIEQHKI